MTDQPLVSIIIPVYNGANYMREAIDSALAQNWPNVEVLVVNDGSDDGGKTREMALSFGNMIRYFEKENGGVATALNLGISEMKGEYFSWLSHDDVYYPDKISCQLAHLGKLKDEKSISFCNCHRIDDTSRIVGTGVVDEALLDNSILLILGTYIGGCSLLIPRTVFDVAGNFNESLSNCQDNEMWLRMAMAGYRFRYLPEALIKSREHAEQCSRTSSTKHSQESRAFYLWAIDYVGKRCRLENAPGFFRVLYMKGQSSLLGYFFRRLRDDRSLIFALGSIIRFASGVAKQSITKRMVALPGVDRLLDVVKRLRFRSSSHYWEQRYQRGGTSGVGSYGIYAEYKAEVLNSFVSANGIIRVAELGCGDGNQLKYFNFAQYLGIDISPAAVELCRNTYRDDRTKTFLVYDETGSDVMVQLFKPELVISLDVIYHLVEDKVFEDYIDKLFNVSSRYVTIYSTDFDMHYDSSHQVDRKFTEYIEKNIKGWQLSRVLLNPHKGADTQSDFYFYEKTGCLQGNRKTVY